jgi:hypothetical protein
MTSNADQPQQIAVWYFVAATFVFAAPTLFFDSGEPWLRILTVIVGFALVIAGGVQLGREMKSRRDR